MAIREVRVTAFRGIRTEGRLSLDGRSLLIHGENGSGKSSFAKALRWTLTESVNPLTTPGKHTDYQTHVLEKSEQKKVSLTLMDGGTIEALASGVTCSGSGKSYRQGCLKANPFLHRGQLASVLNDRPIDRFRYFEGFLDLGQADELREVLQAEADDLKNRADTARELLGRELDRIGALLPTERRPAQLTIASLLTAVIGAARELHVIGDTNDAWEAMTAIGARAAQLLQPGALAKKRALLSVASEAVATLQQTISADPLPPIEEVAVRLEALCAQEQDAALQPLLEHAERHLQHHQDSTCPLCMQRISHADVINALRGRLERVREAATLRESLAIAAEKWQERWCELVATAQQAAKALGLDNFRDHPEVPVKPDGLDLLTRDMSRPAADFARSLVAASPSAVQKWFTDMLEFCARLLTEEKEHIPPDAAAAEIAILTKVVADLSQNRQRLETLQTDAARDESEAKIFSLISDSIRKARQDVAQNLLNTIAARVSDYYEAIHPPDNEDEVTRAPTIEVHRMREGIAYLRGVFHGQTIDDPRRVYSDGHLDTVGICVFLALRRFRGDRAGDPRLMVLDDVVLSIDLPHARRLLALIAKEFRDHQTILLTHSEILTHWCVSLLPNFKRVRISGWSIDSGPRLSDYPTAIDRVRQSLESAASAKELALMVMALMDEWLVECRLAYALAIPAKRGEQYTMTEIWEPFCKAIIQLERDLKCPLGATTRLIDKLKDLPQVRNMLPAHENEFARDFPLSTMKELTRACLELVQSLYCVTCGKFATPIPSRHQPELVRCDCRMIQCGPQPYKPTISET